MKKEKQFKAEYIVTLLFIGLGIIAIKFIGFKGLYESIFTSVILLEIPVAYIGSKIARTTIYDLIRGRYDYENK